MDHVKIGSQPLSSPDSNPALVMEREIRARPEHFGTLALRVPEEADWIMERTETFFMEIGAIIAKRKPRSIKAGVAHPDGFTAFVSVKFYHGAGGDVNIVNILRRSGDSVLFGIVYRQFLAYDFGRGEWPKLFYDGQMCPRPVMKAHSPPLTLPSFRLDPSGEKRKISHMLAS